MKEKIKQVTPWLIAILTGLIIAALILMNSGEAMMLQDANPLEKLLGALILPIFHILNMITHQGLEAFSGGVVTSGELASTFTYAVIGLSYLFVIVPWLLASGTEKNEELEGKSKTWYAGIALSTTGILIGLAITIVMVSSQSANVEDMKAGQKMDYLNSEMRSIAVNSAELMVLPHDLNGGNGFFTTFLNDDGEARDFSLDDLTRANPDPELEIEIERPVTDSTLTIIGRDDLGHEVRAVISPYEENMFRVARVRN